MLDRKTKNIDANVELLMDRKKGNEILCVFALILGAIIVLSGALLYDWLLSVLGLALLIVALAYVIFDVGYRFLIQSRKIMNCQQNQILLINEVLNGMDSLKRKSSVKKVKK